jgi:hypothetical protein
MDGARLEGTLEEWSTKKPDKERWDQFAANEKLFGVKSTYKEDLSQYTTPLNVKALPAEVRHKAKLIATDIERRGRGRDMDTGAEYEEEGDEENLFSAVPRSGGYNDFAEAEAESYATEDGGMGGALLASLRAGSAAASAEGSGRPGCDHRSLIAPRVQNWWRARRMRGATIPPGAEDALICPFSERVFGDVSQLVTHWAAALPRGSNPVGDDSCEVATAQFRQAAEQLRWAEMAAETGLDAMGLSVSSPKAGSVWAQVIAKLEVRGKASSVLMADRKVTDFVNEAVQMRCWQRNQKVEHREVLESIAAGLALHILGATNGATWAL